MPYYFILDKQNKMHGLTASSKEQATEPHNDHYAIKADQVIEAVPCPHPGKYVAPDLPSWMEYYPTKGCGICYKCSEQRGAAIVADGSGNSGRRERQ